MRLQGITVCGYMFSASYLVEIFPGVQVTDGDIVRSEVKVTVPCKAEISDCLYRHGPSQVQRAQRQGQSG